MNGSSRQERLYVGRVNDQYGQVPKEELRGARKRDTTFGKVTVISQGRLGPLLLEISFLALSLLP
jgi:hypothetical protein